MGSTMLVLLWLLPGEILLEIGKVSRCQVRFDKQKVKERVGSSSTLRDTQREVWSSEVLILSAGCSIASVEKNLLIPYNDSNTVMIMELMIPHVLAGLPDMSSPMPGPSAYISISAESISACIECLVSVV